MAISSKLFNSLNLANKYVISPPAPAGDVRTLVTATPRFFTWPWIFCAEDFEGQVWFSLEHTACAAMLVDVR